MGQTVLFNLRLLFARGRLIHGHFDRLIGRCYNDGPHGRVIAAHVLIIDRPVAVEVQTFLVAVPHLISTPRILQWALQRTIAQPDPLHPTSDSPHSDQSPRTGRAAGSS